MEKERLLNILFKNNYVGIELSKYAKILAEKKGIRVINSTIEEFSKNHNDLFDIVCSFQVLEMFPIPKVL